MMMESRGVPENVVPTEEKSNGITRQQAQMEKTIVTAMLE
jgi:hypothetical protein